MNGRNIEVEIRSFISKEQFDALLGFFKKNARFIGEDFQETYYFDAKEDLRVQRNNFFSKICLKKGKIHDEAREEVEIKFNRDDFENLINIFLALGFKIQIKWFRKRYEFEWDDIKVCLDYTKGYGYIIELEKKCPEEEKEFVLNILKQKLRELNIELTPREEFEKRFQYYKENWENLIKDE
jgi:predicted adenylyl cyclase CyaB